MNKTANKEALLSIGEVSSIFGIHQDTLRNWEKKGLITPLRVGPRKDRKYKPEDIYIDEGDFDARYDYAITEIIADGKKLKAVFPERPF